MGAGIMAVNLLRCATVIGMVAACSATNSNTIHQEESAWYSQQDGVPLPRQTSADEEKTIRFILRDKTGTATAKLNLNGRSYQVKSGGPNGLVETFGKRRHADELVSMGFELMEFGGGEGFSDPGYHNPEQLHTAFAQLASKYPNQAKLIDLTHQYSQAKTVGGRSIYALKVSKNAPVDEAKPNVLLVSNHHAREVITPELALDFATRLLEGYEKASNQGSGDWAELVQVDADEARD